MSGIYHAPGKSIDKFAVRPHRFEKRLELRMDKIFLEKIDGFGNLFVENRVVGNLLQYVRHVDENHRKRMALGLERIGILGRHPLITAGDKFPYPFEKFNRLLRPRLITARKRVFRIRDRREALGENIAALSKSDTVFGNLEKRATVLIEAVFLKKFTTA